MATESNLVNAAAVLLSATSNALASAALTSGAAAAGIASATYASNAAVFGSNLAVANSNARAFDSNAAAFGSNAAAAAGFASNAASFASNAAAWSNAGACNAVLAAGRSNVGIGLSAPAYTLDVAGTVHGTSNLYVGSNVGPWAGSNALDPSGATGNIVTSGNISAGNLGMFRNRVINGDMSFDQRNSGGAVTILAGNSGTYASQQAYWYLVDRWTFVCQISGLAAPNIQIQQNTGTPPNANFLYSLRVFNTAASAAAVQVLRIGQAIEGYNIKDLGWTTASGSPITVSFWVLCSATGTANFTVSAGGTGSSAIGSATATGYSYRTTYTIASASVWQYVVLTIPAPPSGLVSSQNVSNGAGLRVTWGLGGSDSYNAGTPNTWLANECYSGASVTAGASGFFWYITGVQVEKGTLGTPFEFRPYAIEQQLCQRYYYQLTMVGQSYGYVMVVFAWNSANATALFALPASMRSAPAISCPSPGNLVVTIGGTNYQLASVNNSQNPSSPELPAGPNCVLNFGTSASWSTGSVGVLQCTAGTSLVFSSEL